MYSLIKDLLISWNNEKNQRIKLQRAYFALAVALAVLSGLVTLVNVSLGRTMSMIAALLAVAYVANAVVWALLEAFVMPKIAAKTKRDSAKKR